MKRTGALFQAEIVKQWVSGKSSGQIGTSLDVSRNVVIGVIHRAGARLMRETGKNPYARPDRRLNLQNATPKKARIAAVKLDKPDKPVQIKREIDFDNVIPGERLPPLVKLDSRLWIPLPGTTPKTLLDLDPIDCRWPIDGGDHLFCAVRSIEGSSMCSTHTAWSKSKQPLAPLNFNKRAA